MNLPVPLQVEWYQSGGTGTYGGPSLGENDFSYDAPSTSAGNFGTFEEEEPLLQGEQCSGPLPWCVRFLLPALSCQHVMYALA